MNAVNRAALLDAQVQKLLAILPESLTPLEICAALVVVVFGLEAAHRHTATPHPDVVRIIHTGKQLIAEYITVQARES